MQVQFSNQFLKLYKKSPKKIQSAFDKRLILFMDDRNTLVLRDHPLLGKLKGYRSINISGDWRALYRVLNVEKEIVYFDLLGTHSQLYR